MTDQLFSLNDFTINTADPLVNATLSAIVSNETRMKVSDAFSVYKGGVAANGVASAFGPVQFDPNANSDGTEQFAMAVLKAAGNATLANTIDDKGISALTTPSGYAALDAALQTQAGRQAGIDQSVNQVQSLITAVDNILPTLLQSNQTLVAMLADYANKTGIQPGVEFADRSIFLDGRNNAPIVQGPISGDTDEDSGVFLVALLAGSSEFDASDTLSVTDLIQTGGRAVKFTQAGNGFALDPHQFNDLAVGQSELLTFAYAVFDGHAKVAQTLTLTIEGRNDAPVLQAVLAGETDADAAPFTTDLLLGASDADTGDALSALDLVQTGGRAVAFLQVGNCFSLDPVQFRDLALGEQETVTFAYNVFDGTAKVAQTLSLTVFGTNDIPVVEAALLAATDEDTVFICDLLAGASDADKSDILSVTGLIQTGGRAVKFTQAGNGFALDPGQFNDLAVGENETLTFAYGVTDGKTKVAQTLTITVEGRNDLPVLEATLSGSCDEDGAPFTINLLAGATDVDATDRLSAVDLVQTGGRKVEFTQAGNGFALDPHQFNDLAVGQSELLTFAYAVFDGHAKVAQTLTLTIDGRNDAPVLQATLSADTNEDAAPFTIDLLTGAADIDGADILSATDVVQIGGRTAVFSQNGNSILIDPTQFTDLAEGESETLTFSYNVWDGHAEVAQTLTQTVGGRNDAPIATSVAYGIGENASPTRFAFVASDVDHLAQLSYTILSQPPQGVVVNNGDGTFSFGPGAYFDDLALGETRSVSFTWKATDEHGADSQTCIARVTVTGANDTPVATADAATALESTPILIAASALIGDDDDVDNGALLRLASVGSAVNGTVALDGSGNVVFTPTFGFAGQAFFSYVVADEYGATASATMTIAVSAVDNILSGGPAAQAFDGGAGIDTVTYAGSTGAVTVNLSTGQGIGGWAQGDTYARIENIIGSAYNDTLIGDGGDNLLIGGAGGDSLVGGAGIDTVSYATSPGAVVVDLSKGIANKADAKKDTLFSIENITASNYDDKITGDAGANVLQGLKGNDQLEGGDGADTYVFNLGDGTDTVDNEGHAADGDRVLFGYGITIDQIWFAQNKFDLVASMVGTSDSIVIRDWYKSSTNHVSQFDTADGHTLADSQVQNLVAAMAGMTPPPIGQTTLATTQHQQLDTVIAANWRG
jgi:VCBS repeat-containing protein